MKAFADLYAAIDRTTSTNEKVAAMVAYFRTADPADGAWATFFLTGGRFKRLLSARLLVDWALEATRLPGWIVGDCWGEVGDLAEIVALLLGHRAGGREEGLPLHTWVEDRIMSLRGQDPTVQRDMVLSWWTGLDRDRIYLLNKLLTGEWRVGVSRTLVVRALAGVAGVEEATIAGRLMGAWEPTADAFSRLIATDESDADRSRPYPFNLAVPLEDPVETLGERRDWQVEWKWDGIRAQLIRRGALWIWSRGEDLVTERFPEITAMEARIPDGTVLDGEIMAWRDGPLPFAVLQTRIGRKNLTKAILEDAPVGYVVYDILEQDGVDVRQLPQGERRRRLEAVVAAVGPPFHASPLVPGDTWEALARERAASRARNVEGLMLKRLDAPYGTGRRKGDWWKWKIEPYTIDAVLIYAQPGSGRRASLYTDYTFAVWRGDELVPFAKAYSGLDQAELEEMDRWIRRHTVERFGPVRRVEPVHVFELAFEGIQRSTRHKSGVAVRFPRIARWRRDKGVEDANTLEEVWDLAEAGKSRE